MKEFLKKNWISSLIFLILISILFMNEYKYLKNTNKLENSNREAIEKCNKDEIPENMITFCEEVKKLPNLRPEFYSMFYNTYSQGFNFMIFIIFPSICSPCVLSNNIRLTISPSIAEPTFSFAIKISELCPSIFTNPKPL